MKKQKLKRIEIRVENKNACILQKKNKKHTDCSGINRN